MWCAARCCVSIDTSGETEDPSPHPALRATFSPGRRLFKTKKGTPIGVPLPFAKSAAAAVVVAAVPVAGAAIAAAVAAEGAAAAATAIAQQQDQNDDPPPVVVQAATNTVIVVAHKIYLRDFR